MWKPVQLLEDYWIILDSDGYTEYEDEMGDNLMFTTKQQALERIKSINAKECGK